MFSFNQASNFKKCTTKLHNSENIKVSIYQLRKLADDVENGPPVTLQLLTNIFVTVCNIFFPIVC